MKIKLGICTIFFLLFFTACSSPTPEPTSTPVDVSSLETQVAASIFANLTSTAAAFTPTPEATPTPEVTPTPEASATIPEAQITPSVTPTETACDNMIFVSDVTVPDQTEMSPGQEFVKTWRVRNIGSCAWSTSYRLVFAYGNPAADGKMSGETTALTAEVLPGAEADISVSLKAPTPLGTYTSKWRLQNNNGYNFGDDLIVIIVVK